MVPAADLSSMSLYSFSFVNNQYSASAATRSETKNVSNTPPEHFHFKNLKQPLRLATHVLGPG